MAGSKPSLSMITHEGLDRNFKFMALEVRRQLEGTYRLIAEPSDARIRRIVNRDGYIDTLKSLIERKVLSYFRNTPTLDERSANLVTAMNVAASNLERIADFCVNIVLHVRRLDPPSFLERFQFKPYFDVIIGAADLITEALTQRDTGMAFRLCEAEERLDELYRSDFLAIRNGLATGSDTDNLLYALQIFHYLERIGDSLLNIGEAVLYSATGEKVKLHEYERLADVLAAPQAENLPSAYTVDFKWETRSGARIGKVEEKNGGKEFEGIFKKGQSEKLHREKEAIGLWDEILPGVPPKVLEYYEEEGDAALLLEFLDGFTFQDLIVNGDARIVSRALGLIQDCLTKAWEKSQRQEPVNARFVEQTSDRLEDVLRVHPEFRHPVRRIGSQTVWPLEELIERTRNLESDLPSPFSVLIHGDFNVDNVIYNHLEERVHFIDLHRSRHSDYVQDISTFLLSCFRLPLFQTEVREQLNDVIGRFYGFAQEYARSHGDGTYQSRLALGLARGFITSTRFELDHRFAKGMYMRGVYLLELLLRHQQGDWREFALNWEVLDY